MPPFVVTVASLVAAYALGSFPTSYLVGRWVKGVDIRQHGSGNAGATNVYRVVGKLPGLLVLIVDIAKGWAAAPLAHAALEAGAAMPPDTLRAVLGVCVVCGHIWSPFLAFHGGKGVASALGVLLGFSPVFAAAAVGIWIATAAVTRYVSVSSIVAVTIVPLLMAVTAQPVAWVAASAFLCVIVTAKHRSNLIRLLRHEEPRLGKN